MVIIVVNNYVVLLCFKVYAGTNTLEQYSLGYFGRHQLAINTMKLRVLKVMHITYY